MDAKELRNKMLKRFPELETQGETPVPNQNFWVFYHPNKELLKEADIFVIKIDSKKWYIQDRRVNIDDLMKKHTPECEKCGAHGRLDRKVAKNGTFQYYWYCIPCYNMSRAIPHILIKHLIDTFSQPIYDHDELKWQSLIEWIKRHTHAGENCMEQGKLDRRIAKNDTIQYYWNCIKSGKMIGPIPHKLAEGFSEKEGQVVHDIE
ncbi:hypothetical protein C6497_05380 [Candidatus Poribacteria bacterium]|nr:MAG: hypothetical protein C6497_05380 [Candidatus Poribacteria bacterium]